MKKLLRLAINFDIVAGNCLPISHAGLSSSSLGAGGSGVWGREEWMRARELGYDGTIGCTSADQQQAQIWFLSRAFGPERRKIVSAWRVSDWIRNKKINSILELGCGEMITSWVLKGLHPELRYLASDFDELTIKRAEAVALLDSVEKAVIDAREIQVDVLANFDLILAWDVLYAFSDTDLLELLAKLAASDSRLLMCTSQIVGPLRAFSYLLKSKLYNYKKCMQSGELRAHGYKCSVGHYKRIASKAGMTCRLLQMPPADFRHQDTYNFLLFEKVI